MMWEVVDLKLGVRHSTHSTYEKAVKANKKAELDRVVFLSRTPHGLMNIQRYQVRKYEVVKDGGDECS
tara:strand:+ start:1471 stop:1674 length:204 start_codon:yes stop_codon:yes gene_type:complete